MEDESGKKKKKPRDEYEGEEEESMARSPPEVKLIGTERPLIVETVSSEQDTSLFVPKEDLTANNFGARNNDLSDRQWFAWAYQTENRVRFKKLENRNSDFLCQSQTLNTDYLIDVYPKAGNQKEDFKSAVERDRDYLKRKALPSLIEPRDPDGSLTPIEISGYDRETMLPSQTTNDCKAVPPNYLFFRIVLEAYCGYDLQGLYNSKDSSIPRGAIMGGAVVAGLSSWRDERVRNAFETYQIEALLKPGEDTATYWSQKQKLVLELNDYFLYDKNPELHDYRTEHQVHREAPSPPHIDEEPSASSPFSLGDTDIFLQPSPVTMRMLESFSGILTSSIYLENISSFISGLGLCHDDLQRFSSSVLTHLGRKFWGVGEFVHALTKHGLSFMFVPYLPKFINWDNTIWPRCTQLIMLSPGADLVGAVMDFDLSLAACTFDGTTVRVTPRAALSLTRKLLVVTPFCFEERRNRKRIVKYYKRGFDAAIIDPSCIHPSECVNCVARIVPQTTARSEERDALKGGRYLFYDEEQHQEVYRLQSESWQDAVTCCCNDPRAGDYTFAVFEQSEGHATEYFSWRYQWDAEKRAEVEAVPNYLRLAHKRCGIDYGLSLFLAGETPVETAQEVLHGEKTFKKGAYFNGHDGFFKPSFYSGGTFSSQRVKEYARDIDSMRCVFKAQEFAERGRYVLKHGTEDGYKPRFIYCNEESSYPLQKVFRQASQVELAGSNRAPVGLNPERFIAQCIDCKEWLHECEYGTEFCEACQDKKPAAS